VEQNYFVSLFSSLVCLISVLYLHYRTHVNCFKSCRRRFIKTKKNPACC